MSVDDEHYSGDPMPWVIFGLIVMTVGWIALIFIIKAELGM